MMMGYDVDVSPFSHLTLDCLCTIKKPPRTLQWPFTATDAADVWLVATISYIIQSL